MIQDNSVHCTFIQYRATQFKSKQCLTMEYTSSQYCLVRTMIVECFCVCLP